MLSVSNVGNCRTDHQLHIAALFDDLKKSTREIPGNLEISPSLPAMDGWISSGDRWHQHNRSAIAACHGVRDQNAVVDDFARDWLDSFRPFFLLCLAAVHSFAISSHFLPADYLMKR
jgi:hypothetical protein